MLACFNCARPIGRQTAAEITEATTAADASASGFVVFSTLVDDPASVNDTIDAFLGDRIVEAASASDTITTGLAYAVAIDETATAAAAEDAAIAAAIVGRSAMLPGVFVNPSISREAHVIGTMVNL